jgi:putative membrane protein
MRLLQRHPTLMPQTRSLRRQVTTLTPWAALIAFAVPRLALAHVDEGPAASALHAWEFSPDIVIGSLVVVALYIAGLRRLHARAAGPSAWRALGFLGGVGLLFLALQSPLDALSEHLFFVHQIQHLLVHSVAPMLIMLAAPQGALIAGSPAALRKFVIGPVMTNHPLRATFRFISRPPAATLLFIGTLFVWQYPAYHDAAVLDDGVHYAMHVSMLFAGLVFFWSVFDSRPAPLGASYGTRMAMITAAILASILLGAATTFKATPLYPAYDALGRLWGMDALTDERLGGIIIWIPGSMMCAIAALVVIRFWGGHELRADGRRRRDLGSGRPAGSPARANQALALRLAAIAAAVFMGIVGVGLLVMSHFATP